MLITPLEVPASKETFVSLTELLTHCVEAGAAIGFLSPLSQEEASAYWRKVIGNVADGTRVILVAREPATGTIVGSAQVAFETRANGRHRAEVQKVMVLVSHRRRGLAAALMNQIEVTARS